MTSPLQSYIQTYQERFLKELGDFLRIPSVSATPSLATQVQAAAEFVAQKLQETGLQKVELIPTGGFPLVYGEHTISANLPTILVYGHYDVQPADPYDLWETPPFEPTLRQGKIYARGASDDKGQVYIHLKAAEAMIATGILPCNIKFLIEGEEEIGSTHIQAFVQSDEGKQRLRADAVLVSDTAFLSAEQPALQVGLRGITTLEVLVQGPERDLHSGMYGGAVANPLEALCKLLAQLKDQEGRILIPGFYDPVLPITPTEKNELQRLPFVLPAYQHELGISHIAGETGYTTLERIGLRPSLDINGIQGGYNGAGVKTVLPSQAQAKLSIRLVPNQDPEKIAKACKDYLLSLLPPGVRGQVHIINPGSKALRLWPHSKAIKAATHALQDVWGKTPCYLYSGGSIPVLTTLQEQLGADIAMMGFGLNTDLIHAPNEHFLLAHFFKGIEAVAAFYLHFYQLSKQ